MILVDTSVWVDHMRVADELLTSLLDNYQVYVHPFVIGELALGFTRQRDALLSALPLMPHAIMAGDELVLRLIDQHRLFSRGIGYVDAHLLASARLTPETSLWTRDGRLAAAAEQLGLAARLTP